MSETQTTTEEPTAAPTSNLGVQDLKVMLQVLEVVSQRGAIRAEEMAVVGPVYNNLRAFLVASGELQAPAAEETTEETPEGE